MQNENIKKIGIIGSTGSIGTQTLEVARNCGNIKVAAISANTDYKKLASQANEFKPDLVGIMCGEYADNLKKLLNYSPKIVTGIEGLCEIAEYNAYNMLVTSVMGNVGLLPTVKAIECGKKILLANKETLVTAGELIMPLAKKHNVDIIPVDSEHSAIFQSLRGNDGKKIKKLILTASGGPFFGKTYDELKFVSKEDALKHPNWTMGSKITIDSATMMNKCLEIIEARWLFDVPVQNIEVVVHRQSIVHSAVEYCDNSVIAQMGTPDMRLPISYAINYPERMPSPARELDIFTMPPLTFEKPDCKTFKCLNFAQTALEYGGTMPAVMNAANEVAVKYFLDGKISFTDIGDVVENAMNEYAKDSVCILQPLTVDAVLRADKQTRIKTDIICKNIKK